MVLIETQKDEFTRLKNVNIFEKFSNEDRYNKDLLVIGLGGAGAHVIASLKKMLKDHISPEDNINWFAVDSDIPAMEQTIKNSRDGIGLNNLEIMSIYRPNLDDIMENGYHGKPVQESLAKWMSSDFPKIHIGTEGAEGNRQIGRLMFSNAYEDLRILLFQKLESAYSKSATGKLDVIIVSSTCGGTGSGIISDFVYNIKAYAKSKKWQNFRIGGCLMTPDVLFANRSIYENKEKCMLLQANSFATLEEINRLMRSKYSNETYTFESTTHRLQMCDNIFDTCILITGKKDDQGYIPDGTIFNDVAYFINKLASNKYIHEESSDGSDSRKLLRDSFFEPSSLGYFKVANEADYRIPIREIENICEGQIFEKVDLCLHTLPENIDDIKKDISETLSEIKIFLDETPGEDVKLSVKGLIMPDSFSRPTYKQIKKRCDDLATELPRQLENLKSDLPVMVKALRINIFNSLNNHIEKYLHSYGPFNTLTIIGASGVGNVKDDSGIIAEIQGLEKKLYEYQPSNEFERVVESILDIVKRRFFSFPTAKRETERGYFDARVKSALAVERNSIIEELDKQDVFGDIIRQLRQRAEQICDIYEPFYKDLFEEVNSLRKEGERITGFLLKNAKRHEFLPSDYLSDNRVNDFRQGLINLMVDHENDINAEKIVPISESMERLYKNFLIGIGVSAPEKLIATAFAEEEPTLMDINVMFVAPDSQKRKETMKRAAMAFVSGSAEKIEKKRLCELKNDITSSIISKKYISLPDIMPYFDDAVSSILVNAPYNIDSSSITQNSGELVITIDSFFLGVKPQMLLCYDSMIESYDAATEGGYMGIHVV